MPRRDLSTEKNNPHIESQGFMLEYIEHGLFIPMRFYNVENYKKLLLFRVNSIINHLFILPLLNKRMFCWKTFNPVSWLPQRAICCLFCYRFRLSSSQTSRPIVALYCLLPAVIRKCGRWLSETSKVAYGSRRKKVQEALDSRYVRLLGKQA